MRRIDTSRNHTDNPWKTEIQCKGSYELGTACNACRRCCNELLTYKITVEERGLYETEKLYNKLLPIAKTINNANKKLEEHGVELSRAEKDLVRFMKGLKKDEK